MFPSQELTALARHKKALRARIAGERADCRALVENAARPWRRLDQLHARWRTIPVAFKLAALPVLFFLKRKIFPRKVRVRSVARWAPLVWRIVRRARN